MTLSEAEKAMIKAAGLTEAAFEGKDNSLPSAEELAEEAYLTAEYNSILIEMLMEE